MGRTTCFSIRNFQLPHVTGKNPQGRASLSRLPPMAMCEYELCLRSVVMKKYFRVKADFAFTSDLKGLHFANLQNQALIVLLFCLCQILKLGMIRPFLSKALQPPEEQAVINALEVLRQLVRVNRFSTSHIFLLILLLQLHRLIKL